MRKLRLKRKKIESRCPRSKYPKLPKWSRTPSKLSWRVEKGFKGGRSRLYSILSSLKNKNRWKILRKTNEYRRSWQPNQNKLGFLPRGMRVVSLWLNSWKDQRMPKTLKNTKMFLFSHPTHPNKSTMKPQPNLAASSSLVFTTGKCPASRMETDVLILFSHKTDRKW